MNIKLSNIGKRYNFEWIFRKVDYEFNSENNYVILGSNGSGKSTLLQVIAGNIIPSEGEIKYSVQSSKFKVQSSEVKVQSSKFKVQSLKFKVQSPEFKVQSLENKAGEQQDIEIEKLYTHLSFASPYLELFEEFTLIESIEFQKQFKPFFNGLDTNKIIEIAQLEKAKNKQLKYYSSGMKQRVRLALAILANTPLLLLDEPTSNLDKKAIDWYQKLVTDYSKDRLIFVCSNQQEYEYPFCNKQLSVEEYK